MHTLAHALLMASVQKRQPIAYVGAGSFFGGSGTVTGGGSMKSGDLMLVLAVGTSTTVPTISTGGWTTLHTKVGTSRAVAVFGKIATGTSEAITCTNTAEVCAIVCRYAAMATPGGTYGAVSSSSVSAAYAIPLPALTLVKTDGTSRVVGFLASSTSSVPSGYSGMSSAGGYSSGAGLYTSAPVSSWPALSGGPIGTASDLIAVSLEILRS